MLKAECLTMKDPLELWNTLKEIYEHQKTLILLKARYEWIHLRLQDFKTVSEYNSAVFTHLINTLTAQGRRIPEKEKVNNILNVLMQSGS